MRICTPWRPWIWLGVPGTLALALYAPIFPALTREWIEYPSLSHGFAIPVVAAYLGWARLRRLESMRCTPSSWGLPVLVAGLAGLVVGMWAQEPFIARISLPVTFLGLTMSLAGLALAGRVWLAIAYLAFMVPLPWTTLKLMTDRARLIDAAVSAQALRWLGVPVFRHDVLLQLPDLTLEVADVCSSIPTIAALLALGAAYALLTKRPLWFKIVLVLATFPIAVSANIIRITTTAAAAYYIGPWTLGTVYHQFNGTVNFLLTFLLILLLDSGVCRILARRTA